ncbi:MAG: 50S ribosomal protein L17 [Ginsengibacter sp.]
MRHGNKNNNLSRTASHRRALLSNLACQLFMHKKIVTTLAKARALRPYAEPLLTKSKENTTHQRRIVFSYLQDKEAIKELFDVISPKIASRPGGYTRIVKLGKRVGDNSEIAMIELVDYNEIYGNGVDSTEKVAAKKTRRAGGSRKKASDIDGATDKNEKTVEATVEAVPDVVESDSPEPASGATEGVETPKEDAVK